MTGILQDLKNSPIFRRNGLILKKEKLGSVCVAMCVHRGIDPQAFKLLSLLQACPDPQVFTMVQQGDALIDRSRAIVASRFLENTECDVLFFLDDDIIYNPKEVIKISQLMLKDDRLDIVGGAYMVKTDKNPHFAIKTLDDKPLIFGENGAIEEVMYVSTGFMGIHRRVIQKMVDSGKFPLCHPNDFRFYPFFKPTEKQVEGNWIYMSEDWAFCDRARELGSKIWVDTTVKLGHAGRYVYDWDNILQAPKSDVKNLEYWENGGAGQAKAA